MSCLYLVNIYLKEKIKKYSDNYSRYNKFLYLCNDRTFSKIDTDNSVKCHF